MDFDSFLDWLKKNVLGKLTGGASDFISSIGDWIEKLLGAAKEMGVDKDGTLAKAYTSVKDTLSAPLTEAKNELLKNADKDSATASTTITAELDKNNPFQKIAATLKLGDAAATDLQKIVMDDLTGKDGLLNGGIPVLDQYGKATPAIGTGISIYNKVQKYLLGDDNGDIGLLAAKLPGLTDDQYQKIAADVENYITGIPAGATSRTMAAAPPKNGLVGMLINLQNTVNGKDYVKDHLSDDKYKSAMDLQFDAALLTDAQTNSQPLVAHAPPPKPKDNKNTKAPVHG